jgi:hypothetical protein
VINVHMHGVGERAWARIHLDIEVNETRNTTFRCQLAFAASCRYHAVMVNEKGRSPQMYKAFSIPQASSIYLDIVRLHDFDLLGPRHDGPRPRLC